MFDPCNPTYVGLTFHNKRCATLASDNTGNVYCVIHGTTYNGANHKDGWEWPARLYANHVGLTDDQVLAIMIAKHDSIDHVYLCNDKGAWLYLTTDGVITTDVDGYLTSDGGYERACQVYADCADISLDAAIHAVESAPRLWTVSTGSVGVVYRCHSERAARRHYDWLLTQDPLAFNHGSDMTVTLAYDTEIVATATRATPPNSWAFADA